jgi:hypothetical protein
MMDMQWDFSCAVRRNLKPHPEILLGPIQVGNTAYTVLILRRRLSRVGWYLENWREQMTAFNRARLSHRLQTFTSSHGFGGLPEA